MPSEFTRPLTAQQAVLEALRRLILSGELPPGTPIVQDALADRFSVSRVPIREALKILEGEGHVTYTAHRGYAVTKLAVADLFEIYQLRGILESAVAAQAVPRLEDEHLIRMRRAMDAMDDAADAKDLIALGTGNREFHFSVLAPSKMHRAIRMIKQLWDTTDPYRTLYFVKPLNRQTVNAEHAEILAACERRDTEAVVALLDAHRNHAVEDLRAMTGSWE